MIESSAKGAMLITISILGGFTAFAFGQDNYYLLLLLLPAALGTIYGLCLCIIKQAKSIEDLIRKGYTDEQIAGELFKEESYVSNKTSIAPAGVSGLNPPGESRYKEILDGIRKTRLELGNIQPKTEVASRRLGGKTPLLVKSFAIFFISIGLFEAIDGYSITLARALVYISGIFMLVTMVMSFFNKKQPENEELPE